MRTPGQLSVFIGIDVAEAHLNLAIHHAGACWRVPNDEAGIATTVRRLIDLKPSKIVLEATGGYETALLTALRLADLPAVSVNPRQIRDFARGMGQLAKTDRLDARVLAHFAAVTPLQPQSVKDFIATEQRQRLHLERLGGYAPEIDPDEGILQHLQRLEPRNLVCQDLPKPKTEHRLALARRWHMLNVIRGCFAYCS